MFTLTTPNALVVPTSLGGLSVLRCGATWKASTSTWSLTSVALLRPTLCQFARSASWALSMCETHISLPPSNYLTRKLGASRSTISTPSIILATRLILKCDRRQDQNSHGHLSYKVTLQRSSSHPWISILASMSLSWSPSTITAPSNQSLRQIKLS